jgi:phage major head subunit gpT-like protein
MAAVMTTGNFAELLWPGIKEIYGTNYDMHETKYKEFMEVMDSKQAFEKVQGLTGFPLAAVKEQGQEAVFSQMFQGYQQEYLHLTYSIGAVVTREMVEDDLYNQISQIPRLIAESMRQTEEIVATNILNNAFSTTGPDGTTLISASHPLVGTGANVSNQPATASDLAQTTLEQAVIDVADFRDDQNLRLNTQIEKIVVPRSLLFTVRKILETQYQTTTNNNDVNILSNMNIKPVMTNFLTDQDAWFCMTNNPSKLKFFRRRAAEIQKDNDFATDNLKIKTSTRFSTGFDDFRAIYGSAGA